MRALRSLSVLKHCKGCKRACLFFLLLPSLSLSFTPPPPPHSRLIYLLLRIAATGTPHQIFTFDIFRSSKLSKPFASSSLTHRYFILFYPLLPPPSPLQVTLRLKSTVARRRSTSTLATIVLRSTSSSPGFRMATSQCTRWNTLTWHGLWVLARSDECLWSTQKVCTRTKRTRLGPTWR